MQGKVEKVGREYVVVVPQKIAEELGGPGAAMHFEITPMSARDRLIGTLRDEILGDHAETFRKLAK